jgi:hypothetical protein
MVHGTTNRMQGGLCSPTAFLAELRLRVSLKAVVGRKQYCAAVHKESIHPIPE